MAIQVLRGKKSILLDYKTAAHERINVSSEAGIDQDDHNDDKVLSERVEDVIKVKRIEVLQTCNYYRQLMIC